ncbi:MAG TPA: class I SAM-dependent methyltransferase [Nanoarchaeota archaeon]|nr:class I SAM-dependent methyltransferase [Nanoarchaeota archaeon]
MEYYSSISKSYEGLHGEEQLKKLEIIAMHIKPKTMMLDIGAGTGISTRFFGIDSVALEPSFEMLKQHKGKKVAGKAEALPFKDKTFSTIISVTALHHTGIEKAISEIKRVSKPGCIYAFTVLKKAKNAESIRRLLKESFRLKEIEEDKDYILVSS